MNEMAIYKQDIVDVELNNGKIFRGFLNNSIGSGDDKANRFGVRVFRNGEPENIGGTCAGFFIRADGATVIINDGVVEGNMAYVTLPETCYAIEGAFSLAIKCTGGSVTGTMRIVDGVVSRTATNTAVDPGTVIPSISALISAIEEAVASVPMDYSGMKRTIAAVPEDENGEVFNKIKWESGGIDSGNGSETSAAYCVRTQFIPIGEGDSIQMVRLDEDDKAPGWYANAFYYDANMAYLGSVRPGTDAYQSSFARIPSMSYANAAYVRFLKAAQSQSEIVDHDDIWRGAVRRAYIQSFEEKLRGLQNEYEIISLEFTNAGGISAGQPYDIAENSQRFRTVTGYPFPKGAKIVIPDDLHSIYGIWVSTYYDAGRYAGLYYGTEDYILLDDVKDADFANQEENYYIAIAGRTLGNNQIQDDMVKELESIIKIAVPKKCDIPENRLDGNVTGAKNRFGKIPFAYGRVNYWYETDGNVIEQKSEDTRVWQASNADYSLTLPKGTYHVYFEFLANDGESSSAIAYKVFDGEGTAMIDYGSRSWGLYNNEKTFTLDDDDTIKIQWKSYAGNRFAVYLYGESYDTLKVVSDKVKALASLTGDEKYAEIYSEPVQELVAKYDASADAGRIGYIWISDLHINSLYPDRNKALRRQLMACADIANRTNIRFIMLGGDIIDRETSHAVIFAIYNEVFSGVKDSRRPVLMILGNHDDNPYTNNVPLTKGQARALFVDAGSDAIVPPDAEKSYYYFDQLGYRFICLDAIDYPSGKNGSNWWGFSQGQVEWLAGVLAETSQKVVILSHITLDEDHNSWNLGNNGGYTKDVRDLLEAYNGRISITLYGNTYNYSGATGKVLYTHAGHAHFDEQYTKTGTTIPLLITTCAKNQESLSGLELVSGNTYQAVEDQSNPWNTLGWTCRFWPNRTLETINEAAFDVVSVGSDTVKVFRVGAGEDRTFTPA